MISISHAVLQVIQNNTKLQYHKHTNYNTVISLGVCVAGLHHCHHPFTVLGSLMHLPLKALKSCSYLYSTLAYLAHPFSQNVLPTWPQHTGCCPYSADPWDTGAKGVYKIELCRAKAPCQRIAARVLLSLGPLTLAA